MIFRSGKILNKGRIANLVYKGKYIILRHYHDIVSTKPLIILTAGHARLSKTTTLLRIIKQAKKVNKG